MNPKPAPKAEFKELSPTTCMVAVAVPPEIFKRKMEDVYRNLSLDVSIPGFRPGKAPKNILNRHFGIKAILHETYEGVIHETLWPALKDKEFMVVGQPRIDHDEWKDGEDFQYTAKLEIVPPVPAVEYNELKVSLPEHEMTEELVDNELRRISVSLGESTDISDRPAQNDDFLLIVFSGEVPEVMVESIDGEVPWQFPEQQIEIELGKGKSIEGLDPHLVGMALEEIKDFDLTLPDDFSDPRVRGKTLKANVRIVGIKAVNPAELTDELIKEKFSEQGMESLDSMRERIKQEIANSWEKLDSQVSVDQVEAYLGRTYNFPLPEGLIRARYVDILDRSLDSLKKEGTDIDDLMKEGSEMGLRIRKRARFQAERLVKMDLLIREIARKESIKVANDEVANYLMMLSMRQGLSEKDMRTLMQDAQFLENTRQELLHRKITHFLLDKVEIERKPEDEFRLMMEQSREEREGFEKAYIDAAGDPQTVMEHDYFEVPEADDNDSAGDIKPSDDLNESD
jgi:trigger factor